MDIEIRCSEPITRYNYSKVCINIYKNNEYQSCFSPWFISYDVALMLTSGIPSLIKQGYEIYKSNVEHHLKDMKKLF